MHAIEIIVLHKAMRETYTVNSAIAVIMKEKVDSMPYPEAKEDSICRHS